jgi:hypothetical protein
MQKKILLHIGTPKTGSTSIQRWLTSAQEQGSLSQVSYPLWAEGFNHQRVVALYKTYDELPLPMQQSYGPEGRHYDRMRDQYRKVLFNKLRNAHNAIISGESFCNLFSPLLVARMREDLEAVGFQDFRIVLYVRDPADFYLSGVQQDLKMAKIPPFVFDPDSFKYDFLNMAQNWEEVFPGKLIIRKFPPEKHGDMVEDFRNVIEEYLGVTVPWAALKMNSSLSSESMQIIQDYREKFPTDNSMLTADTSLLISFLQSSEHDFSQTKPVLRQDFSSLIRANHKADANLLYSRYGVDLNLENAIPCVLPQPKGASYRVTEIVESLDPGIINRLLLRVARMEFSRPRPLLLRIAARIYHKIPLALRSKRLETWLKKLLRPY